MGDPFGTLTFEPASTVDRVADELRRAIFDGEIESGTALREMALADSLDVSRSTVREALTVLVADGIAVRIPNRGVAVAVPDPDSIRDGCRARVVLESAGMRAWASATPALRDGLRDALRTYTDAVAAEASYRTLNQTHLDFHHALVRLTDSPRLIAMAASLYAELRLALAQVDRVRRNAHDQADSHVLLMRFLEDDDIDGAVAALEQHLSDAERDILAALALG